MIRLIPTPKECAVKEDTFRVFAPYIQTSVDKWREAVSAFTDSFRLLNGITFLPGAGGIVLVEDQTLSAGCYTIDSVDSERGVIVRASGIEGVNYALASLIQLIEYKNRQMRILEVSVRDYPDKDYRAFMVDLGRYWHPYEKLLKYVDLCYLYKIRYLHLHFVDFGLYTLPSKAFPRLSDPETCYTYEQITSLNAYAKARGVIVVPEYECPGHASIMAERYPEQFANHYGGRKPRYPWYGVMCAGSETVFESNKTLLGEIAELFPDSPFIHIGGDEAFIDCWDECPDCKAYMKARGIADVHGLYSDFVAKIAEYVFTLGKTPIVWEGFPPKGAEKIPKDTIVAAWESQYQTADQLLAEGFRIINCSWKPLYVVPGLNLSFTPFDILKWNVYNWQHWSPKSAAYLNPIVVAPTNRVLGSMLCAWDSTFEREIRAVMENLCAMSERAWNVRRILTDDAFIQNAHRLLFVAEMIIRDR